MPILKGPQVHVERPIRRPELTELETFVIAARGGSLASAARRLRISTPAVAKRIDSLEATVGLRLLERGRSGVRLTDEGRRLVPHAERLLDRSDDLLDDLAVRRGDAARIRGVRGLLGSRAPSTEAVLSETEALLAQIFHLSSNGIFVARPADLHLYDVNEAFCSMLAYRRDELLRLPASALWADPAGAAELTRSALEGGGSVRDLTVELWRATALCAWPSCRHSCCRSERSAGSSRPCATSRIVWSRSGGLHSTSGVSRRLRISGCSPFAAPRSTSSCSGRRRSPTTS